MCIITYACIPVLPSTAAEGEEFCFCGISLENEYIKFFTSDENGTCCEECAGAGGDVTTVAIAELTVPNSFFTRQKQRPARLVVAGKIL